MCSSSATIMKLSATSYANNRSMMTSWNGNIFRVTGPLCGEFTGPGEFPTQRPVTRSFDVFFDLCLNKRLSKQQWGWWFETLSCSLWRQCNDCTFSNYIRAINIKTALLNLHVLLDFSPWRQSHSYNFYNNCTTIIIAHLLKTNKLRTSHRLVPSSYTKYLNHKAFKLHKSLTGGSRKNASELCRRPTRTGPNSRDFLVESDITTNTKSMPHVISALGSLAAKVRTTKCHS